MVIFSLDDGQPLSGRARRRCPASTKSELCSTEPSVESTAVREQHCSFLQPDARHPTLTVMDPIFLSHGSPTLPFEQVEAAQFLRSLGQLPRPRAILMVSAHWETSVPTVNSVAVNGTIHDFRGFPRELYELSYPAPGSPALAARVVELLAAAGIAANTDPARGLDHGAWAPLLMAWPDADIPVVQLSVQPHASAREHWRIGRALAPLAAEGVLVLASGNFTHDLSSFRGPLPTSEPGWVSDFADWMDSALTEGRTDALLDYAAQAPHARDNHPTPEHLLPLFVALGAAGDHARGERIHRSLTHGVLRMDAYRFTGTNAG